METCQSALRLLLLGVLAVTCGCSTRARFADVSDEADYRALVGEEYALKVPMHLSGVNLPPGYRKIIDLYVVNPTSPSWSGPELVSRDTLPVGTRIVVESVQRCTNCFLDFKVRLEARIRIPGYEVALEQPVTISLGFLEPEFVERQGMRH